MVTFAAARPNRRGLAGPILITAAALAGAVYQRHTISSYVFLRRRFFAQAILPAFGRCRRPSSTKSGAASRSV